MYSFLVYSYSLFWSKFKKNFLLDFLVCVPPGNFTTNWNLTTTKKRNINKMEPEIQLEPAELSYSQPNSLPKAFSTYITSTTWQPPDFVDVPANRCFGCDEKDCDEEIDDRDKVVPEKGFSPNWVIKSLVWVWFK